MQKLVCPIVMNVVKNNEWGKLYLAQLPHFHYSSTSSTLSYYKLLL